MPKAVDRKIKSPRRWRPKPIKVKGNQSAGISVGSLGSPRLRQRKIGKGYKYDMKSPRSTVSAMIKLPLSLKAERRIRGSFKNVGTLETGKSVDSVL
jgi:hypothetical protein